jgi:Cdc6-like AAA superfamily ATPase
LIPAENVSFFANPTPGTGLIQVNIGRYFWALVKGRDDKITSKCENVTKVISDFRESVPFMTLGKVNEIEIQVTEIARGVNDIPETILQAYQDMPVKPENLKSLMPRNNQLEKVKNKLNVKGMSQIESRMKMIGSNYVKGTFSWLEKNDQYLIWFKAQASPFLCVSGPPGAGKTYFTSRVCSVIQETRKAHRLTKDATKAQENISLAYFFFDSGRQDTQSLQTALSTIIVQIASQDSRYCENIAKEVESLTGKTEPDAKALWTDFILAKLQRRDETKRQVYVLLDGIDELKEEDAKSLLSFFAELSCDKIALQVMITGSPEILKDMKLGKRCDIDLPENAKSRSDGDSDISKIIKDRISKMENLKGFKPEVQQDIVKYLDSESDGMPVQPLKFLNPNSPMLIDLLRCHIIR